MLLSTHEKNPVREVNARLIFSWKTWEKHRQRRWRQHSIQSMRAQFQKEKLKTCCLEHITMLFLTRTFKIRLNSSHFFWKSAQLPRSTAHLAVNFRRTKTTHSIRWGKFNVKLWNLAMCTDRPYPRTRACWRNQDKDICAGYPMKIEIVLKKVQNSESHIQYCVFDHKKINFVFETEAINHSAHVSKVAGDRSQG